MPLSSALDCGEKGGVAMVVLHTAVANIDSNEPANMIFLLAFEWTQTVRVSQDGYEREIANV